MTTGDQSSCHTDLPPDPSTADSTDRARRLTARSKITPERLEREVILKVVTLCHIVDADARRILLGRKKRGFGKGKLNGFGGKIEPGESEREAAIREIREEAGIEIPADSLRGAGRIHFRFPFEPAFDHEVHLFLTDRWIGDPHETSEMTPAWFDLDAIPYEEMWADDPHWMPLVLSGKAIEATFTFAEDNETVATHEIREIEPSEAAD